MAKIKDNPSVSVIIPTYNRAHLLGRAIQSVLNQTYKDFEIIVVDDGSTDNTEEVMKGFDDRRIRYIRLSQNSGGSSVPRNIGLKAARGEYIASLDDDDFWLDKDKLKSQVEFLEDYPDYVLVGTNSVVVNENGHELARSLLPQEDEEIRGKLLEQNCFVHGSVMFRKAAMRIFAGYSRIEGTHYSGYSADDDLWLKLGTVGKFTNLPIYGVSYTQLSTSTSPKNRMIMWVRDIKLISSYKDKYPNYWRAISFRFVKYLLDTFSDFPPMCALKKVLKRRYPACWRVITFGHKIILKGILKIVLVISYPLNRFHNRRLNRAHFLGNHGNGRDESSRKSGGYW